MKTYGKQGKSLLCAKRSVSPPAHSNLSRIRLGMTFNVKAQNNLSGYNVNKQYLRITYRGKKKKGFSESNDTIKHDSCSARVSNNSDIVQNDCNIA